MDQNRTPYDVARVNLYEALRSLSILADDCAKKVINTDKYPDLDQLDSRIMNLHDQLHGISYIAGAASAIRKFNVKE